MPEAVQISNWSLSGSLKGIEKSLPLTREVARLCRDGVRETLKRLRKHQNRDYTELFLSLPQSASLTAPSSEGAI